MSESIRTFADALREARDAPRTMAMAAPSGYVSPEQETGESGAAETLESRIVQPRGPHDPANPIARCDYCPRTTLADALVEVVPGAFACDGCVTKWAREVRSRGGTADTLESLTADTRPRISRRRHAT